MNSQRRKVLIRIGKYEWSYALRKLQLIESFVFLVSLVGIIITGLGDTQSFFIGESSPIPKTWLFFKNSNIVLIASILTLAIPPMLLLLLDRQNKSKDSKELLETIRQNVVPGINLALQGLLTSIKRKFKLKGTLRISLWIPLRKKIFNWNLQMVCKTNNIPEKELDASFDLDEGVIGYTYLKNVKKYSLEFIDVSNPSNLPENYIPLQNDNKILINSDIKGVLAIASFQDNSTLGLLAIDTDNIDDLSIMNDPKLHDMAVDWIVEYSGVIKLLWRMKNNV